MPFWIGPHGVLVPDSLDSVVAEDCCNTQFKDGGETEMCGDPAKRLSPAAYLQKYAVKKVGKHYYLGDKFWTGPHGVLVPDHVNDVIAEDCCNTLFKDGSTTKMCGDPNEKLSKEAYLFRFSIMGHDGKRYYSGEPEYYPAAESK